jgi:flavin reductase (DIM6/NTAB) family NADH-FMN oxidoreductase RutF
VARSFGTRSSRQVDKFATCQCHLGATGVPLLDECAWALECRVEAVHDLGTQKLIIGQVVGAEQRLERYDPLIYREEDYQ